MSSHTEKNSSEDCLRWDIPKIDELLPTGGSSNSVTARSGQRSYDDGFEQGRADGLAAGQQELQSQVTILQRLLQSLTEPFTELDENVESALLSLATTVASRLVRRELTADPELVLVIVREAISLLPVAARSITLQLHPEDALLVQAHMSAPVDEGLWRIEEDAACSRGGCIVITEHSRIDASLEQQIERIAASVLGAVGDESDAS